MYLAPWQIFLIGVMVGMFVLLVIEIIFVLTHITPVGVSTEKEEEEETNG